MQLFNGTLPDSLQQRLSEAVSALGVTEAIPGVTVLSLAAGCTLFRNDISSGHFQTFIFLVEEPSRARWTDDDFEAGDVFEELVEEIGRAHV